jgi:hypothetical protein
LISGAELSLFQINPTSGVIETVALLDYDAGVTSHNITVVAADAGETGQEEMLTVTVNLANVNDNPPVCTATEVTADVSEAAGAATLVSSLYNPFSLVSH